MKKILIGVVVCIAAIAAYTFTKKPEAAETVVEVEPALYNDQYCLAEAIFFESGNQPISGKVAVAHVILNRVKSKSYPNSICDVVHQGPVQESWKKDGTFYPVRWKCQFSYWCDGKSDKPTLGPTWDESMSAGTFAITTNNLLDITEGATHYHADYVYPNWADNLHRIVYIQDHVFYK